MCPSLRLEEYDAAHAYVRISQEAGEVELLSMRGLGSLDHSGSRSGRAAIVKQLREHDECRMFLTGWRTASLLREYFGGDHATAIYWLRSLSVGEYLGI